jgi:hypothetical protein
MVAESPAEWLGRPVADDTRAHQRQIAACRALENHQKHPEARQAVLRKERARLNSRWKERSGARRSPR